MTSFLSRDRIADLLVRARDTRIAVVGDAMLDVYLVGEVERISPEAPVPVVRVRNRKYALGGAANVAQNVRVIGAHCDLVALVGADAAGEALRRLLADTGVGADMLLGTDRATTQKTRLVARSQQLLRFDEEEDAEVTARALEAAVSAVRSVVARADALVLEDYNKGLLAPAVIRAAIDAAAARGLPIVVDPKFRNFFEYRGATIFKPNRRELEAALGATVDLEHPEALGSIFERLGVSNLLLTLGERGMVLLSAHGEVARVETVARQVYDVVGAGDTVSAYLAVVLAAGGSPVEAAIISNVAAGIEVGKLGAATVSSEELLAYVHEHGLYM